MTYGTFDLVYPDQTDVFAYTRTLGDDKVLVIGNLDDVEVKLDNSEGFHFDPDKIVLNNYQLQESASDEIILKPYEARVYRLS